MFEKLSNFARRNWFAVALACAVGAVPAISQVFTAPNNFTFAGHVLSTGNPPATTTCTLAAGSTDLDGNCALTAAAGAITFATPFLTAPNCIAVDATSAATVPQFTYTVSTTAITISTATSGHTVRYHCTGVVGG